MSNVVNHKEIFISALYGMFFAWGGDTPSEVYWAGNDLLNWYELEFGIQLNIRFDEENFNYPEVIEAIRNT